MAVIQGSIWQPRPGGVPQVVAGMSTAKKIHERLGGRVRAWQNLVAGESSGRLLYTIRYPNFAAFAGMGASLQTDPEWQKFVQEVLWQPDPAATLVANSVLSELPGFETQDAGAGTGRAVSVSRQWVLEKGRMADATAVLSGVQAHVERLGARMRALQFFFGGTATGQVLTVTESDDLESFGAFSDKAATDPEFSAFRTEKLLAANSPLTLVNAAMRVEVQI